MKAESRLKPEEVAAASATASENILQRAFRGWRRKFPAGGRKAKESSDDLWRLWYLGIQSMTMSVSVMADIKAADEEKKAAQVKHEDPDEILSLTDYAEDKKIAPTQKVDEEELW